MAKPKPQTIKTARVAGKKKAVSAKLKITLKTGVRKNLTIDPAKIQAAIYLLRNNMQNEVLVSTDKKGVFAISEGRFVKVKKDNKTDIIFGHSTNKIASKPAMLVALKSSAKNTVKNPAQAATTKKIKVG